MKLLKTVGAAVLGLMVATSAYAGDAGADVAQKLMDGNNRFATDSLGAKNIGKDRRQELAKGQHPSATVVTCSDSRVSPELLYDQGLGDVFVIRVAGNVVDPIVVGSIEYGVEHLHTPLLVILGHQSCGAVTAALETGCEIEGNIGAILKKIMPAVDKAKASGKEGAALLEYTIQENVRNVYEEVMATSPIVKELVHEGKLKVVMAEYYLDSGKVVMLEGAKAEHEKVEHEKPAEMEHAH